MWHLLARHPDVRRALDRELAEVLGGRPPAFADLPRLVKTRAIVDETMRLYPPVWLLPRRAVDDDEIGGYRIPAGSDVLLCVYSLHRHPELWEAPEEFRPQRFESASARTSAAYLPFGGGPRACLGRSFGQLETSLVAATVAQAAVLQAAPGRRVKADPLLTLSPQGLWMKPLYDRAASGAAPAVPFHA
jgi:cytochrome P450